jgi:hypothetical protein
VIPIEDLLARAVLRPDATAPADVVPGRGPGAYGASGPFGAARPGGGPAGGEPGGGPGDGALPGSGPLHDLAVALGLDLHAATAFMDAVDAVDPRGGRPVEWRSAPGCGDRPEQARAAEDLGTLCEAVVIRGAADSLPLFISGPHPDPSGAGHFPDPAGARVIGCVLQLTGSGYGARFWWQYAAGAGDPAASYCLYLQHLSLGEPWAAAWWGRQSGVDTEPAPAAPAPTAPAPVPAAPADRPEAPPVREGDATVRTTLRVLRRLRERARPRADLLEAVLSYVPGAVHSNPDPDIELPLPEPDFADHIGVLVAATASTATITGGPADRCRTGTVPSLPARTRPRERGHPRG